MTKETVTKRARSAKATRQAMLEAATRHFAQESYENVGLRDIAGDVGVDVALVHRYFGGKEEMFKAALRSKEPPFLKAPTAGDLPAWLADLVMGAESEHLEVTVRRLLIILRSASSPKASELVKDACADDFLAPMVTLLQEPYPELRASVALACLIGASIMMQVMKVEPLWTADPEVLRERLVKLFGEALR